MCSVAWRLLNRVSERSGFGFGTSGSAGCELEVVSCGQMYEVTEILLDLAHECLTHTRLSDNDDDVAFSQVIRGCCVGVWRRSVATS